MENKETAIIRELNDTFRKQFTDFDYCFTV